MRLHRLPKMPAATITIARSSMKSMPSMTADIFCHAGAREKNHLTKKFSYTHDARHGP